MTSTLAVLSFLDGQWYSDPAFLFSGACFVK